MPSARIGALNSSPHSSDEATHNGTPSTNITAFSPEAVQTTTKKSMAPKMVLNIPTAGSSDVKASGKQT